MTQSLQSARIWLVFALALAANVLNLFDRMIIAVLKPQIASDLNWSDSDYGTLAAAFQAGAAIACIFAGRIVDRVGVRWAYPLGITLWSLAAMAHGWASSFVQFLLARISLGATEAMGTPSSIKTIATLFDTRLRSTGFGLSNAVASLGAIIAPLLIPLFALLWGWRMVFIAAGLFGLLLTALWLLATRGLSLPPGVDKKGASFWPIVRERKTWAIAGAKVLSDATWFLMLYWMPDFLHRQFGLSGVELGPPLALAYVGSAVGALLAGSASSMLLMRGWPAMRVRQTMMFVSALCVLPLSISLSNPGYGAVVGLLALALAGHQGFSTSLSSLIADITPHENLGRVAAVGTFCSNLGGIAVVKLAGVILALGLGYGPLFLCASMAYFAALGWILLLLSQTRSPRPLAI